MKSTRRFFTPILLAWLLPITQMTVVQAQSCSGTNCVWPGDANANGIVNAIDFIYVGQAYLQGGPERPGATTDWEAQAAPDWPLSHPVSGVNFKHADGNGDGFTDGNDLFNVIVDNFGETNENFITTDGYDFLPGDDLFLTFSNDTPMPGEMVEVTVHLGETTDPVEGLYGIAFELKLDTSVIQIEQVDINNFGGWLGTPDDDMGTVTKYVPELDDAISFAFTRIDGQEVTGGGAIASFTIVMEDVIIGLEEGDVPLVFTFENVLALGLEEEDLMVTFDEQQALISSQYDIPLENPAINIYPNPTHDIIQVQTPPNEFFTAYQIYSLDGRLLTHQRVDAQASPISIPLYHLPKGQYCLVLQTAAHNYRELVILQ
ncbi:MAG: T9SS type A sorting domain-containing protein [Bacteroidota bacterium]